MVLVHNIGTGKSWWIKRFGSYKNENSLYYVHIYVILAGCIINYYQIDNNGCKYPIMEKKTGTEA